MFPPYNTVGLMLVYEPRDRYSLHGFVCLYLWTVCEIKLHINICLLCHLINALQADLESCFV